MLSSPRTFNSHMECMAFSKSRVYVSLEKRAFVSHDLGWVSVSVVSVVMVSSVLASKSISVLVLAFDWRSVLILAFDWRSEDCLATFAFALESLLAAGDGAADDAGDGGDGGGCADGGDFAFGSLSAPSWAPPTRRVTSSLSFRRIACTGRDMPR